MHREARIEGVFATNSKLKGSATNLAKTPILLGCAVASTKIGYDRTHTLDFNFGLEVSSRLEKPLKFPAPMAAVPVT